MAIRCPKVVIVRPFVSKVSPVIRSKPTLKISTTSLFHLKTSWNFQTRFFTTQNIVDQTPSTSPIEKPKKIKTYDEPATKLLKLTEKMNAAMKKKKYSQVWGYLNRLRFEKIQPTQHQYTLAIESYAKVSKIDKVLEVFEEMKRSCGLNTRAYNALIECVGKATHVFDEAKWKEILDLVNEMKQQNILLRTQTYEILMKLINPSWPVRSNSFTPEKRLEIAEKLFDECGRKRIPFSPRIFSNLLVAYRNLGKWEKITKLYETLNKTGTRADLLCLNIFWQAFKASGDNEMAATIERLRNERIHTAQLYKTPDPALMRRTTILQEKLWQEVPQKQDGQANQPPSQ